MATQQSGISAGLAEIFNLPTDELKQLVNSDSKEKFEKLIKESDRIKNLENEREVLLASVKSLAEYNLALQPVYEADRSKLFTLVSDCNKVKEEIEDKAAILLEISRKTSIESTLAAIAAAASEAEKESENSARLFLAGELDCESFTQRYCDKQKLAHNRRIKADRLRKETNESWTGSRTQSFGHLSRS